jgi:chemotaxis protein MotB
VIDQTPKDIRIQIVDREGKPMFASGSFRMPKITRTLLAKITQVVQKLPNKVSLSGHTDAKPFRGSCKGYGNWELSTDRALAGRRMMVESGLKWRKFSMSLARKRPSR